MNMDVTRPRSVQHSDAARVAALQCYAILDTAPEPAFDRIARMAAAIFDTPTAMLSLVDADRQWFKASCGVSDRQTPRNISFCHHAIQGTTPLVVTDAREDPRFATSPLVTGPMSVRFYAGVPLINAEGHALGSLCVVDTKPRQPTQAQIDLLRELAAQALHEMEVRTALGNLYAAVDRSSEVERALRDHSSHLEALLEATSTAVITANADSEITSWSAAAAAMFGYNAAEVLGKPIDMVLPHQKSRAGAGGKDGKFADLTEPIDLYTRRAIHKSGREFWVEQALAVWTDEGGNPVVGAILRDVTERKRAEQQLLRSEAHLAAAQRFAGLGGWEWDLTSGMIKLSGQMCEAHQLPIGTEWPAEDFRNLVYPEDRRLWQNTMDNIIAGEPVPEMTLRAGMDDGSIRYIRTIARLVRDETGAPSRVVGIAQDVTEQVQQDVTERQREKLSALGHLAGGVAHELNNLLLPIISLAEQIDEDIHALPERELDAEETSENLKVMLDCGRQARDIVQKILLFARKESPTIALVDMSTILQDALGFIRKLLPHTITLDQALAPDAAGYARLNRGELIEVLANLAVNAAHAMEDRGTLRVTLTKAELDGRSAIINGIEPGLYFQIAVADTGCGMDEATLEHIFEPFFTTKEVGHGTGLGLSVAHGILRAWRGAIVAQSRVGEGTTFTLLIPAVEAASA